ncbi:hypothetical protein IWZ01DRAFT_95731 [Phyllosticta capitalensis]
MDLLHRQPIVPSECGAGPGGAGVESRMRRCGEHGVDEVRRVVCRLWRRGGSVLCDPHARVTQARWVRLANPVADHHSHFSELYLQPLTISQSHTKHTVALLQPSAAAAPHASFLNHAVHHLSRKLAPNPPSHQTAAFGIELMPLFPLGSPCRSSIIGLQQQMFQKESPGKNASLVMWCCPALGTRTRDGADQWPGAGCSRGFLMTRFQCRTQSTYPTDPSRCREHGLAPCSYLPQDSFAVSPSGQVQSAASCWLLGRPTAASRHAACHEWSQE